ncbi:hypothetical protein ZIOFF_016362 [Zingiber officinale]|uniref:LysM domain-containing protein n=1 Tax=Zingiber officinale TaxID=94328 RepID=A0A8J5LV73_ZINOF|nr:hypothetical protein ZIOFF_016362 [Zingiber officinale]
MASSSSVSWMAAEKVSWYSTLILMLLLVLNCCEPEEQLPNDTTLARRSRLMNGQPCDEIYVVREGETLQTISEKCNDPFILEENPHILDFDDVYPGLVIKITSFGGN